jgi:hypothetical protein
MQTHVREVGEHLMMLARLARDLSPFLRAPLGVDEARSYVTNGVARREERFLHLVERAVYGVPRSPYRRLLAAAGCELGDVRALVAHEGLQGALTILADKGVSVTFDEFKGRRPVVRGSSVFRFAEADFDNPLERAHYVMLTGGSRGRPARVRRSLASVNDLASMYTLVLDAYGIVQPRNVYWVGAPLTWALVHLKLRQPIDAWLYPIRSLPATALAAMWSIVMLARLAGYRLPQPRYRDLDDSDRVAVFLATRARAGQPVVVNTVVSSAVRVSAAAAAMGMRLDGVTFLCRSEPLSASRRRYLDEVGAVALPEYATIELPFIAYGCARGNGADDVHLCSDRYAVIQHERPVFGGGPIVDALLFTSLSPHAPKIALNAETGDSARVEARECGCLLGANGLTTHLSEIRSFEKLSSEGTSFARSNVSQIIEERLPKCFGGTALDYQIVEEERPDGATRLVLRVHPGVRGGAPMDTAAVRAELLEGLAREGIVDQFQARLIERAGSIEVVRLPPLATRAGKVLPFHLAQRVDSGG